MNELPGSCFLSVHLHAICEMHESNLQILKKIFRNRRKGFVYLQNMFRNTYQGSLDLRDRIILTKNDSTEFMLL